VLADRQTIRHEGKGVACIVCHWRARERFITIVVRNTKSPHHLKLNDIYTNLL
jgi:hypothetical protein